MTPEEEISYLRARLSAAEQNYDNARNNARFSASEVKRLQAELGNLLDINQGLCLRNTELAVNKLCLDEHERIYEALGCKFEGEAIDHIKRLQSRAEVAERALRNEKRWTVLAPFRGYSDNEDLIEDFYQRSLMRAAAELAKEAKS